MAEISTTDPTMDNMPPEMLDRILGNLEPIEKLIAKRVCRKFYGSVNRLNPGFLTIDVFTRAIRYHGLQQVRYLNRGNNCHIKYGGKEKIIENSNYLDVMISDLLIVLKNRRLDLTVLNLSCNSSVVLKFHELAIRDELMNIRTKDLMISTDLMCPAMPTILNVVNYDFIHFWDHSEDLGTQNLQLLTRRYRDICDLIPISAKIYFEVSWFRTFPIDSFLKFKKMEIKFELISRDGHLSSREIGNIIQILLTSEVLESCSLSADYEKDELIGVLKNEVRLQGKDNVFEVQIPDKNESYFVEVLEKEIKITRSGI